MAIRSFWAEDYTSSDQELNENVRQSLYAMHEQIMDLVGIKLLFDTDTSLWGWEGINMTLKGQQSGIKFPTRTVCILDAASKILNTYKYVKVG